VNLVNKKNIAEAELGKNPDQVRPLRQCRPVGDMNRRSHFIGDDVSQRRFPQSRRPMQKHVFDGFLATASRFDGDLEFSEQCFLADVFGKSPRPQGVIELLFRRRCVIGRSGDDALSGHCLENDGMRVRNQWPARAR